MGFVGGSLGYSVLKLIHSGDQPSHTSQESYDNAEDKLVTHFGESIWDDLLGKTVIDFGSGLGRETVEIAKRGAGEVIGLEIQDRFIEQARALAQHHGVADKCRFQKQADVAADVVISLDSFEHFDDPSAMLELMASMLKRDGEAWISFGWCWYHPYGGHLFSVFPWAHLIFTEKALIRWRSDFKHDGATRFGEVAGGLNQMTIARFEAIVAACSLKVIDMELKPIRALRWLHGKWTREFTTALIRVRLRHKFDVARRLDREPAAALDR